MRGCLEDATSSPPVPGTDLHAHRAEARLPVMNAPDPIPDAILLSRIRDGDAAAFAEFYDRHAPLLFGIALKILQVPSEAEEVLQDACVTLWERAPLTQPGTELALGWAVTIVRNRAIDRLRSRRRHSEWLENAIADGQREEHRATDAAESLSERETAVAIRQALARLPTDQRLALELAFFRGLTQQEIADHLRQPLGTIKARIRRGMMTLRDQLEGPQ
jgi:RNA polymerase sigma-70 factor, ECF subfamily